MTTLIRSTFKLLFRNKAFWFFLLIAPAISILIMNVDRNYSIVDTPSERHEIVQIEADEKVAYYGGAASFAVKVYDASGSELSGLLLQDLAGNGMYTVCRAQVPDMTDASLGERIRYDAMNDRMGAVLYISPDFDALVREGRTGEAVRIAVLSDDSRSELFVNDIKLELGEMMLAGDVSSISNVRDSLPRKETVKIAASGERELSREQENSKMKMGYAFSILTFGFVFCGVFVAHTAIEEQKNMVLTRIRLTGSRDIRYIISKAVCAVIVSVMITAVLAAGLALTKPDIASIGLPGFVLIVFMIGIIFSITSLFLGMISGEVMSSNFIAFTIWCMSSLFAGLYFPLDDSSKLIKAISLVMPQRWFMEGVEMILVKDSKAFVYLICITAAYLMVILSIGNAGIRLRKQEA